uniref:Uncharacterized protein n=1 Tax=Triticum urartu TaxID=4572 RepID=A0A8R7QD44_TRIUA
YLVDRVHEYSLAHPAPNLVTPKPHPSLLPPEQPPRRRKGRRTFQKVRGKDGRVRRLLGAGVQGRPRGAALGPAAAHLHLDRRLRPRRRRLRPPPRLRPRLQHQVPSPQLARHDNDARSEALEENSRQEAATSLSFITFTAWATVGRAPFYLAVGHGRGSSASVWFRG